MSKHLSSESSPESDWRPTDTPRAFHRIVRALSVLGLAAASVATTACTEPEIDIGPRSRSSAALSSYGSCSALEQDLKSHLADEMRAQLLMAEQNMLNWGWGYDVALEDAGGDGDGAVNAGTRQEGVDFSGTNNQEQGVDEADIVKTDGYFIYVVNGDRLEIMGVPEFGELTKLSAVEIEGIPSTMLLEDDRAVIFSSIYPWALDENDPLRALVGRAVDDGYGWYWRGEALTKMTVVELSEDRLSPQVAREVYIEGYLNTGREVEGSVRMVSYAYIDIPGVRWWPEMPETFWMFDGLDPRRASMIHDATRQTIASNEAVIAAARLEDFVPNLYERIRNDNGDTITTLPFAEGECSNFAIAEDAVSRGFTSILTIDLTEETLDVESDHVLTNHSHVYASGDVLLIAEPAQDWWWYWNNDQFDEATNLHRFDISVPGQTTYTGSGRVPGTILGQFALSEYEGWIRVASTTGQWNRWWMEDPTEPQNHVFTLSGDNELNLIGRVDGIAPGETIWSSRFVEDKGYLVTFRNVDPLFTIDLSDQANPQLIGELKVTGVSTYIHPLGETHLLTIGYAGTEDDLEWGTTQISLFDVSNFADPVLDSDLSLTPTDEVGDWSWGYSEALYEHKAFQYWGPQSMLAVPLSTYRYVSNGYEYVSRLELINAAAEQELTVYGSIDHSHFFNDAENDWFWGNRDVRRSIFMGDYIYAISGRGVTCHRLDDLTLMAEVELEGVTTDYYYGERW